MEAIDLFASWGLRGDAFKAVWAGRGEILKKGIDKNAALLYNTICAQERRFDAG